MFEHDPARARARSAAAEKARGLRGAKNPTRAEPVLPSRPRWGSAGEAGPESSAVADQDPGALDFDEALPFQLLERP